MALHCTLVQVMHLTAVTIPSATQAPGESVVTGWSSQAALDATLLCAQGRTTPPVSAPSRAHHPSTRCVACQWKRGLSLAPIRLKIMHPNPAHDLYYTGLHHLQTVWDGSPVGLHSILCTRHCQESLTCYRPMYAFASAHELRTASRAC